MTPCIVILEAIFKEGGMTSPEFKEYSQQSNENGEAHGGIVQSKHMILENLGQGIKPDFVLVVAYPSREKAKAAFSSKAYKSILPLRDKVFEEVKILLT